MPTYKPDGYTSAAPYLLVAGAEKTLAFLEAAFDAERLRHFTDDGGRVVHAEVRIDDTVIMLGEPPDGSSGAAHVHVYVPDVDATYAKALDAGGTSVQAPMQKDDPDRRGGVRDPGGTTWWISTQVG